MSFSFRVLAFLLLSLWHILSWLGPALSSLNVQSPITGYSQHSLPSSGSQTLLISPLISQQSTNILPAQPNSAGHKHGGHDHMQKVMSSTTSASLCSGTTATSSYSTISSAGHPQLRNTRTPPMIFLVQSRPPSSTATIEGLSQVRTSRLHRGVTFSSSQLPVRSSNLPMSIFLSTQSAR